MEPLWGPAFLSATGTVRLDDLRSSLLLGPLRPNLLGGGAPEAFFFRSLARSVLEEATSKFRGEEVSSWSQGAAGAEAWRRVRRPKLWLPEAER